jgi:integrase
VARHAEGWKVVWRRGVAGVRFTHANRRYEISTGKRDPREAAEEAGRIYADVVAGRLRQVSPGVRVHPGTPIEELAAKWIVAIAPELGTGTDSTYGVYAGHWVRHFNTLGGVTPAGIGGYQRARLGQVVRSTIVKERSALRRFLTWLVEQGILGELPDFPALPKKALGTRKPGRRGPPTELSEAEARAVLAALPELSPRSRKGKRWPVRARFVLAFETGLRPATLEALRWGDVTPFGLHIRAEVDKNRWERTVPLSAEARAALAALPQGGPGDVIFGGGHDYRAPWRAACVEALGEERGGRLSPYDLKHARVTAWLDGGAPVLGVRFLTGTKLALDAYAHASRRAAEGIVGTGAAPDTGDIPGTGPVGKSAKERT